MPYNTHLDYLFTGAHVFMIIVSLVALVPASAKISDHIEGIWTETHEMMLLAVLVVIGLVLMLRWYFQAVFHWRKHRTNSVSDGLNRSKWACYKFLDFGEGDGLPHLRASFRASSLTPMSTPGGTRHAHLEKAQSI